MNCKNRSRQTVLGMIACAASALAGFGCGDSGGSSTDAGPIVFDGRPVEGCITVVPPEEEPHLLSPPVFPTLVVLPGSNIQAEVRVDGETRVVMVELTNFWDLDAPPLGTETVQTGGNESITFTFATETSTRGRFFFRITLCADDCARSRVVFTQAPDHNEPYERIVFEGDLEVRRTNTCFDLDSVAVQ